MREKLIQQVDEIISDELDAAKKKFLANNSRHESYAVLLEEFEEMSDERTLLSYELDNVWDATKKNSDSNVIRKYLNRAQGISRKLVAEAVQTAAMIDKFLEYENSKIAPVQPQPFALTNRVWTEEQKRDIALIKEAHKAKRLTKKMNSDTMGKTRKEIKSKAKSNKRTDIDDTLIVYMRDVQKRTIKQIAKEIKCCPQTVLNRYNRAKRDAEKGGKA